MSTGHYIGIVPPFILARTALNATVSFLRENDPKGGGDGGHRSLREELEWAANLKLEGRAIECMRTACAAGDLTMFVDDPRTAMRHGIPAEYFDQRATAEVEFVGDTFGAYELPEIVVSDSLFKLVRVYRGWVHGFVEHEFRAWLNDRSLGPGAGPRLRPVFSTSIEAMSHSSQDPNNQSSDVRNADQLRGNAFVVVANEVPCDVTDRLAEWIFQQHPDEGPPKHKKTLLDLAINSAGEFKKEDFTTAYQRVYDTKRGSPPLTGWPLKEPYKTFLMQRKNSTR
jgi:hypothetical protein